MLFFVVTAFIMFSTAISCVITIISGYARRLTSSLCILTFILIAASFLWMEYGGLLD